MPQRGGDWVHAGEFALVATLTVHATFEVEFPRRGLIRLTHLDRNLVALRDSMKRGWRASNTPLKQFYSIGFAHSRLLSHTDKQPVFHDTHDAVELVL